MRHANIDELLSIRDRAPVDALAARHVEHCDGCRAELVTLEERTEALRELPGLRPERDLWDEIVARAGGEDARPGGDRARYFGAVGLVATVVMAAAIALVRPPAPEGSVGGAGMEARDAPTSTTGDPDAGAADLDRLIAESRRLERSLRAVNMDGQVVNSRSAATMSALEQRIAVIDYQLARGAEGGLTPTQQRLLWRQRVNLMDSLVRLRYAEARRTDF